MQNSFSRRTKIISGILVSTLIIGFLPWREIRADANTHGEYSAYPLEITYDQTSSWGNSTQGQFEVTNVSGYDVTSWTLEIDYYDTVTLSNIWNVSDITDYSTDENIVITSDSTIAAGQAKVGNFTISFLDMTLPVAGLPVEVYRTYDSRQRTQTGDFGYGWTMSIGGPDISISTGLGEEWGTEMRMVLAMPMYYWAEVHPHEVYIDWGNGHEEVFKLVLSPESTLSFDNWVGISATFQNTSGTGNTLEILDGSDNLIYADNSLYTSDLQKFDPQNFLLTRYDGMKFYFNKVSGLYKIE